LSADGTFYVLALSQNEVRLLEGSRFAVQQVELDDVPESLADALKWDDPETTLQWHNGTGTRTGRRRMAMFHGHGYDDATAHRDHILRYFQQVARGIEEILSDEHAPLVLAGVDYVLAIYREAAPHAYISEEAIIGNQEQTSDRELHRQAWAIVEPLFKEEREAARAQYEMRAGQGSDLASSDICEIVWAAQDGRVETLFVALGVQRWGLLEAHKRDISLLDEWLPQAVDLLDLAAARTLSQGGNVYAVAPDDVLGQADAVAVFRYAQ
ncbi:MAG: hypothetical protein JXA74_13445, partial [Anaerolineae bacterium]|nr:hypothetical protein [Anaerolineae bacterium]